MRHWYSTTLYSKLQTPTLTVEKCKSGYGGLGGGGGTLIQL